MDPSTTYSFDDTADFALASREKVDAGYVYTRWANPTIDAFEAAVADLESTEVAEAFSSGMAAISTTFLALCSQGDRIVAAKQLYGGAYALLAHVLPRYGITTDFFDVDDLDGMAGALAGAKALFCETIGNPGVRVASLDRLGALAREKGVPLIVDNTFASPVLCRPTEHGANVVLHSATKFIGGHHDLMGGVVCTDEETIGAIRGLAQELGPTMSPFNAWLALRGLATIQLRVERSSASALRVARALEERDDVNFVAYPALDSSDDRDACERLLGGRGGGTLGFDVAGGRERAASFQEALEVVSPAASLGGTHSLIVHAASVTHTQLSADELAAVGIAEGFCRLSIGLEDADDLIADLTEALDRV
jgi:methionine-gamma-lyase